MAGTYEEDVVILGFSSQVLEDGLFPEPLHVVPVVDETVLDGVVKRVGSDKGRRADNELTAEGDASSRREGRGGR
jgi:hypothetical protein